MSTFSSDFADCLSGKGMPAPVVETANEALEFIHQAHAAVEGPGFNPEMTVAEFMSAAIAGGFIAPAVGSAILEAGEAAGEVLVMAFLTACVACLVSAAGSSIRDVFASNPPDAFVREQLAQLDIDVDSPTAVA
jgi:hypothetical protein